MNIYVGNLPYSIRNQELRDAFEEFGDVESAEVILDRRSKRSRGYGFVKMSDNRDAESAISALHRQDFYGRELRVHPANSPDKPRDKNKRNNNFKRRQNRDTHKKSGLIDKIKSFFKRQ